MYIYIYISCWSARGPENRSKTWLRGSPRRAAREPEANRGGQNATKIGFREVSKSVEKSVASPFWPAGHFPKPEKIAFFDSLRAPAALRFAFFLGFRGPVAERKSRKRFVSAGFASGAVFGPPCFCQKNGCPKKCEKVCVPKNGAQLMFWSPISDHFWRTVSEGGFPAVRSAFLGPCNARKMPLSDLSPCGLAWDSAEKNALPAVSRVVLGNGLDASQNSTSSGKDPMETAERNVFGLIDRNNTEDDKVRDINRAPKIAFSLRSRAFRATFGRSPCGLARSHSPHPLSGTCSSSGLCLGSTWLPLAVLSFAAALCCGV